MKILLTGASGMVGFALQAIAKDSVIPDIDLVPLTHLELDICDLDSVVSKLKDIKPDFVINSAAYTIVDNAENDREACFKINVDGPKNLVEACNETGAHLVHISTDFVFDGEKPSPYLETDKTCPINVYGESKEKAEQFIQSYSKNYSIVRTALLFGPNRDNFLDTMIRLANDHAELKVVYDQKASPTYTFDLAEAIYSLIKEGDTGIFHLVNEDGINRYDLTKLAFRILGLKNKLIPVSSDEFPRAAKRPRNSVLANTRFKKLPYIEDALRRYLAHLID